MTDTTRQVIGAFAESLAAVELAEDVLLQDHAQGRVYQGRAEVESLLQAFLVEGFPEARTELKSIIADESLAVLKCIFHGKQNGPFLGIPSTGREVVLPLVIICQISDDQIQHINLHYDAGGLLRQLGLAL